MTQRDVGALALRIGAVLALVPGILGLRTPFSFLSQLGRSGVLSLAMGLVTLTLSSLIPLVILLCLSFLLWTRADVLAERVMRDPGAEVTGTIGFSPSALLTVSFLVLGLFLVVHALPGFVEYAAQLVFQWILNRSAGAASGLPYGGMLGMLSLFAGLTVEMALGIFLLLRPFMVVNWLRRRVPDLENARE